MQIVLCFVNRASSDSNANSVRNLDAKPVFQPCQLYNQDFLRNMLLQIEKYLLEPEIHRDKVTWGSGKVFTAFCQWPSNLLGFALS